MTASTIYLYLISPLHTGGTTQEGNLLGIARESHTNLPYIPSSSIRGRLRSITPEDSQKQLWGNTIDDLTDDGGNTNLTQGSLWVGDASILWFPVPSLSHGVIWVTSPMLIRRWQRLNAPKIQIPQDYSTNLKNGKSIFLKDAILKDDSLKPWNQWEEFLPTHQETQGISRVIVLPDQHCTTLIQMSLWRQVKIKLDESKSVDGGFRYEEAIPPDTLMYLPWGMTVQSNGDGNNSQGVLTKSLKKQSILQVGGQESLGRGFVQHWVPEEGDGE